MSPPLTLLESASLTGRYRYVELELFSALGRRAASCEAEVSVYLAGASLAHSWRARELEARLPVSVGLPGVVELTRSPSGELDAAVALAVAPGAGAEVLDAVVGALYPAMELAYAERVAAGSPVSDPPVLRLLARLRSDLEDLRRAGEAVAAGLGPVAPDRRREVAERCARAGGVFGPLRFAGPARSSAPAVAGSPAPGPGGAPAGASGGANLRSPR